LSLFATCVGSAAGFDTLTVVVPTVFSASSTPGRPFVTTFVGEVCATPSTVYCASLPALIVSVTGAPKSTVNPCPAPVTRRERTRLPLTLTA
jgi:hypothetical protein